MDTSPRLSVGDRIGNYVITKELGSGATAHVFKAVHERLHQHVAVKVLRPALEQDLRDRFQREVEALVDISSPYVPQIHDVGELEDGSGYFVMELLRGDTLERALRDADGRGLAPDRVIELARQLAEALDAIHLAGWVHRDVKASNIVLHEAPGEREVLKLCDLGIAVRSLPINPRITGRGMTAGTPEHMSPEQAHGVQVDGRSDVFAAGTLLYRLVSGCSPFARPGDRPIDIMRAVIECDPTPLAELCPRCPPHLIAVIERCMAKAPANRFQSARELRDALEWFNPARAESLAPAPPRGSWLPSISFRWGDLVVPALVVGLGYLGYTSWIEDPSFAAQGAAEAATRVMPPTSAFAAQDEEPLPELDEPLPAAALPSEPPAVAAPLVPPAGPRPHDPAPAAAASLEPRDPVSGDTSVQPARDRSDAAPRRRARGERTSPARASEQGPATTTMFDSAGFQRRLDRELGQRLQPITGLAPLPAPLAEREAPRDGPVPPNPYDDAS